MLLYEPTDEIERLTSSLPLLAVEIASSDPAAALVRRFAKFAAAGLPRYWVIDPERPDLLAFELSEAGAYRQVGEFACGSGPASCSTDASFRAGTGADAQEPPEGGPYSLAWYAPSRLLLTYGSSPHGSSRCRPGPNPGRP